MDPLDPNDPDSMRDRAYKFWNSIGAPKSALAPMVEASELAYRLMVRRYGCELTYGQMISSTVYCNNKRKDSHDLQSTAPYWYNDDSDAPLILQLNGHDAESVAAAAKLIYASNTKVVAVDLNLGCPQNCASRRNYGAFLAVRDPDSAVDIVKAVTEAGVPIFVKIRIFPDVEDTVEFALRLQNAGALAVAVHGRTIKQKAQFTGVADWMQVKAVKDALVVPVMCNGNISTLEDARECMQVTGVDCVMSAVGILRNPRLFSGQDTWGNLELELKNVEEFLEISLAHREKGSSLKRITFHLFNMFYVTFCCWPELRLDMHRANTLEEMTQVVQMISQRIHQEGAGIDWTKMDRHRPKWRAGDENKVGEEEEQEESEDEEWEIQF